MTASAGTMHAFIEALSRQVPSGIHPSADRRIGELFGYMRTAVDNPAEVRRLMQVVVRYVIRELNFNAENAEHFPAGDRGREAYHYRHQAKRFAARWGVS